MNRMKKRLLLVLLPVLAVAASNAQELMSLQQAIQIGLENNYSIILVRNDEMIARNNNTLGNAGFWPKIDLNSTQNNSFSTTHQETFAGTVKDINNARNQTLNANVALNWTLFDGMSMFATKNALEVMEEMGETATRIAIENTVRDIILNYYGVVQQQKLIVVLEDAVALSLQRLKIAEAKHTIGKESRLTLLQSTVDLNADSARLIGQRSAVRNTKAELNRLLARDIETDYVVTDTVFSIQILNYDSLINEATAQNSDVLIARYEQRLAELNLKDVNSARYPRLNLTSSYSYNELNSQTGFAEYSRAYGPAFGFNLTYNLFNGFNTKTAVENSRILVNSSEITMNETLLNTQYDVFIQYNDYLSNLDLVRLETFNQEVAKENVDIAFEKYRIGTISDIELRETQKKLIDAQYQLLLYQFQAKSAEVELLRISGGLFTP